MAWRYKHEHLPTVQNMWGVTQFYFESKPAQANAQQLRMITCSHLMWNAPDVVYGAVKHQKVRWDRKAISEKVDKNEYIVLAKIMQTSIYGNSCSRSSELAKIWHATLFKPVFVFGAENNRGYTT